MLVLIILVLDVVKVLFRLLQVFSYETLVWQIREQQLWLANCVLDAFTETISALTDALMILVVAYLSLLYFFLSNITLIFLILIV